MNPPSLTEPPPVRVPSPLIDPRIRARRIEVRRRAGRRRRRRLIAVGAVAALTALAAGTTQTPLLDVDHRRVRGTEAVPEATVLAASGIERGQPLLSVDPAAVATRVERLAWVAEADVRRSWPGTVEITIDERRDVAQVAAPGTGWALVAADGVVVEERERPWSEVVVLEGIAAGEPGEALGAAAQEAVRVVVALPPPLAVQVEVVHVSAGGELRLELAGGAEVRFGDAATEVGPKLTALDALATEVDLDDVAVIDVRVPSAPALTRSD